MQYPKFIVPESAVVKNMLTVDGNREPHTDLAVRYRLALEKALLTIGRGNLCAIDQEAALTIVRGIVRNAIHEDPDTAWLMIQTRIEDE
jgi:hypothetical protein